MRNSDEDHCFCNVTLPFVSGQLKEDEPWLIRGVFFGMGALNGIGGLINENLFEEWGLFERGRLLERER